MKNGSILFNNLTIFSFEMKGDNIIFLLYLFDSEFIMPYYLVFQNGDLIANELAVAQQD